MPGPRAARTVRALRATEAGRSLRGSRTGSRPCHPPDGRAAAQRRGTPRSVARRRHRSTEAHAPHASSPRRPVVEAMAAATLPPTGGDTVGGCSHGGGLLLPRLRDAHGAGEASPAEAAVAVRVLAEVLLVVVLGVEELGGLADLGGDLASAGAAQDVLVRVARGPGALALQLAVRVDRAAVLRADVVALAHALGGIVALPECLQDLLVGHDRRVEHHSD